LEIAGGGVVNAPAIQVEHSSLAYRLARSTSGTAKEYVIQLMKRQVSYEQLWALRDVSFTVDDGEVLGFVGPNGAGKSTLMKMLARVLPPTDGRVVVRGSVAPMIELGAGFNTELTGFENIVMYGTLLGRTPQLMRDRADEIAAWADLSGYLDVPLRSYSSGMLARLGFSVATDTEPDVLIVDEVLSVGDASFQQKSSERMRQMIANGASVVLVSHNLDTVRAIADRVVWLDRGVIVLEGDPEEVVGEYERSVS
jgi:ABC-type polysaccharide/polyol phosphate transport system ATPase subunit